MSKPRVTTLDRLVRLKRGYDLPKPRRRPGVIPILGSFGVTGWHDEAKNAGPGVTIGRSGASIGVATFHDGPFWPLNTALYAHDFLGNEPRYVYYLLKSIDFANYNSGSAQPSLNRNYLEQIPVVDFNVSEQRQIANVLGSLDDLIENNRRRVDLLAEMARVIYREWFVKFRHPGHEDVTFVDSILGPIPKGWAAGKIDELCSRVQAGATPRRSIPQYWDEPSVDWYKTGDLTDGVLLGSSERLSKAGFEAGRTFEAETILMAIYGSPTVGRLGLLTSRASANQAALGLVANTEVCTTEYLWFALESLRGHLNQIAQGAAQQNVSKEKVIDCDVLIPPREVVEKFTVQAAPAWRLSHELAREVAVLEGLRDLLLPKLVTGQVDVSTLNLDVLVESAVTA